MFEGGVRGTTVLYHKDLMESLKNKTKNNPTIFNGVLHLIDVLPTLYGMAGGNVSNLNVDGVNMHQAILQENQNKRKLLLNIEERENTSAILSESGRFKLVKGT